MHGLIVVLIDGLGADHFASHRSCLPNLNAMAETGCLVQRLSAEMCASSMPGRASIITGVPPSVHGIYSNEIWDGSRFRNVNSTDIRIETLPAQARRAGLDVASIGFGMIGPDASDVFHAPFWAAEMLDRQDGTTPSKADDVWIDEINTVDRSGRLAALTKRGLPARLPTWPVDGAAEQPGIAQECDQILVDWSAGLATSSAPPDLILTEIASPDYFLHLTDCLSASADHAIERADTQLGRLISCLRKNRALQNFNMAVMSDHGFSNIEESIHPDIILPKIEFSCAAGVLHIHYDSQAMLDEVTRELSVHGVTALDNGYLPPAHRSEVAAFLAPAGCDFYLDYRRTGVARSSSKYRASHGFAPGFAADEPFCVFAGPDVPRMTLGRASAGQIAPTLASLIGLQTAGYPAEALFGHEQI